jgi:plasmid maintenance system killer protein
LHGYRESDNLAGMIALPGDRVTEVNDQWCLEFRWSKGDAHAVRLTDYH